MQNVWRRYLLVVCTACMWCSSGHASNVRVSIGELSDALASVAEHPDAVQRAILLKIQTELNDSELVLDAGQLLLSDTRQNIDAGSGCNRTEIRSVTTQISLQSDTALTLTLDSLNKPIRLGLELDAQITANGRAKQNIGFRLGSCQDLANDNFSFSASGLAQLSLQLELRLNPILDESAQQLVLRPVLRLTGDLSTRNIRTDVNDSLLGSLLERVLEEQIDDALNSAAFSTTLNEFELKLTQSLDKQLENGLIIVELPTPSDEQITALYRLLSPVGDFSLSLGFLRTHRIELLAALVLADSEELSRMFSDAAQCEAAGILQTKLTHRSVFQLGNNGCELTQIPTADESHQTGSATVDDSLANGSQASWYHDAACQLPLDYYATSTVDFCTDVLDTQRLGNASSKAEQLDRWTLSPGTRFDIGALALSEKQQPFTQRVNYKTVDTAQGTCHLEMRIHSINPAYARVNTGSSDSFLVSAQTGLEHDGRALDDQVRALIAYHGGSWQRRSSGALGVESFATQFANEGFVVFAPFYRLIGTSEGNAACNNATLEQVLQDASDALDWVQAHGADYGVTGKPVLFGQSAGGHLAAVLSVERPKEIASSVLFYAPTDFADFARQLINGEIDTVTGQRILESVLDEQLHTLHINSPLIQRNTLPGRIVNDAIDTPPLFLLHGLLDTVLPVEQSRRLCNALSGNPDKGPASLAQAGVEGSLLDQRETSLRQVVNCDASGSELHLIRQGEHALDLCIADELCLAGSPASAALVSDSIASMLEWVNTTGNDPLNDQVTGQASGGSIGLAMLGILLVFAIRVSRIRRVSGLSIARNVCAAAPTR